MISQNIIMLISMASLALIAGDELDNGRVIRAVIIMASIAGLMYAN